MDSSTVSAVPWNGLAGCSLVFVVIGEARELGRRKAASSHLVPQSGKSHSLQGDRLTERDQPAPVQIS